MVRIFDKKDSVDRDALSYVYTWIAPCLRDTATTGDVVLSEIINPEAGIYRYGGLRLL